MPNVPRILCVSSIAVALVLMVLPVEAKTRNRAKVESQIIEWSRERAAELEKNRRPLQADEWNKRIQDKNYEWLAYNLAGHYAVAKLIILGITPKDWKIPKVEASVAELKSKLATLGWYIQVINES